jgi:hypothetical protein
VWDINQVAPGAAVAAGLISPGQVYPAGTTNARKLNALRPFVGYAGIGQISPRFYSNYNGLQTSLQKRFGGTGLLNVNYTFSKDLTTNQSDRSSGVQYSYCIPCEYGRASLDRKHIFTANGVYDLPFFRSRKDAVGKILGGVELSGILTANSGLPFTALDSRSLGDPAASGLNGVGAPNNGRVASPRPNQIGDPNQGAPHTWAQFFNTAAFAPVTVGGAPGNAHRGSINGPGLVRFDLALLKNFAFTERFNLQFRAEAFNVFNHTNFSSIDRTRSSPTFGQVTATRDPRVMQLALKLGF